MHLETPIMPIVDGHVPGASTRQTSTMVESVILHLII